MPAFERHITKLLRLAANFLLHYLMAVRQISPQNARRLAITKQQLSAPQPPKDIAGILALIRQLGCLQLDPVRVVERTHLLVLWSRLGCFKREELDKLLWEERHLFEYWAHAASIVLTEHLSLHHGLMRRYGNGDRKYEQRMRKWVTANDAFKKYILAELGKGIPLATTELEDRSVVPWESDGWSKGRNRDRMLDFLWTTGQVMVAGREGIRRKWTLSTSHLPAISEMAQLSDEEICRQAAQISLRALGVGTVQQIKKHFIRGRYHILPEIMRALTQEQLILPAVIQGDGESWGGKYYLHTADLPLLERLENGEWSGRTTLLSPFDNLICDRTRTELMWDFHFRIEIYVPKSKRKYGPYVLPILHDDRLIGRINSKMDRQAKIYRIEQLWAEAYAPADAGISVVQAIQNLGRFLGAERIEIGKSPAIWRSALKSIS